MVRGHAVTLPRAPMFTKALEKMAKDRSSLLLKLFVLTALFWTVIIASFAIWTIKTERDKTTTITLAEARSFFKQIVTTRYWNSLHGGVYVPTTKEIRPNPFLDVPERDVLTKAGQLLTLINPAYMTRQIAALASDRDQVRFHITSLKPIRPANAATEWEAAALAGFSTKTDEYHEWKKIPNDQEGSVFRYMAPLWTERTCLRCHAKQGYAEGDLRGGISVSIPAQHIVAARDKHILATVLGSFFIWVLGISGIALSFRAASNQYKKRSLLIEQLQNALNEVRTLKGLIPICSSCKKVRDDDGYWEQIERYIRARSEADFTHSICPECVTKLYPDSKR